MEPKIEQVTPTYLTLGEAPHWDAENQVLYYVDIFGKTIHRYDPSSRRETIAKVDSKVGFIIPIDGRKDHFVIGLGLKFVVIKWDGESENVEIIETLGEADLGSQINDGKADPNGRLFAGTLGKEDPPGKIVQKTGALYTINKNGLRAVAKDISLSNGLVWNLKKKTMYYIDSWDRSVYSYDYHLSTGDIDNRKTIVDFEKYNIKGMPDGMTIDTDGNLWIAYFDAQKIIKVDPNLGKILQTVDMPVQVTSVNFGGADLDELYVTTTTLKTNELPPNGALFIVKNLGVKGYAGTACRL